VKDISGQALRMDPDQRRGGPEVAHLENHRLLHAVVVIAAEAVNAETSPLGGKIRFGDLLQSH